MATTNEVLVTLPGARRIDAHIRGHVIRTDQPLDNGGEDSAPSPYELFLASLGTCAGIFVQGFCAARNIPCQDIRIVERLHNDDSGTLQNVELEIQLPESFPERYREAVLHVVERCSVKRAIQAQPHFSVRASTVVGQPTASVAEAKAT